MAHLLGSKFCIESLQSDVCDLQGAVSEVISRTGPVHMTSWKYPDKAAEDLDMEDLLEQYDYSEDEEERQVAHICLMELVIDRLIFLVQCMSKFLDQTMAVNRATPSGQQGSSVSIGLIIRKYWNKMMSAHSALVQLQSESKSKARKIAELEETIKDLQERGAESGPPVNVQSTSQQLDPNSPAYGGLIPPRDTPGGSQYDIARDSSNKSSQTLETAFVPCESCERVQQNLREVGDMVINVCETQSLPSSLSKFKHQVIGIDWFTANDVNRWTTEQNKDLKKINKHLEQLMSTIDPMKKDISSLTKKCEKLQQKLDQCDREMDLEKQTQKAQQKQYEQKIKDIEKENSEAVGAVERKNDELIMHKQELEANLDNMKQELQRQEQQLRELDQSKRKLAKDLEDNSVNNAEIKHLEERISVLHTQLEGVTDKLRTASKELTKQQAVNKSITKSKESLQGKQESLIERIDLLDQENQDLKGQVSDLEEEREALEMCLEKVNEEKEKAEEKWKKQQAKVSELTREKTKLEHSISELQSNIGVLEEQIQENKEREQLLVTYPDLNGPVNSDLTGTGDIALDMENQVKANSVRIQVLEKQNATLRASVTKILTRQTKANAGDMQAAGPVPLWKNPEPMHVEMPQARENGNFNPETQYQSHLGGGETLSPVRQKLLNDHATGLPPRPKESNVTRQDTFTIGRGHSASKRETRPRVPSAGKSVKIPNTGPNTSSIAAYVQLKKQGLIKPDANKSRRPVSRSGSDYEQQETFICHKCDKMYTSAQDLEIHGDYCYG